MTKEEIAELIDKMPQDMDVNDFIHELVNRALAVERKWVGLTDEDWDMKVTSLVFRRLRMSKPCSRLKERTHEPRVHSATKTPCKDAFKMFLKTKKFNEEQEKFLWKIWRIA
jgi:hypothetical protein